MRFALIAVVMATCVAGIADVYRADGAAKVYTDGQGVIVTVVSIKPRKPEKALVKIVGTRTDFDDQVLLHEVNDSGRKLDLKMSWRGKDYVTITGREHWGNALNYELYPTGRNNSVRLRYDKALSEKAKADDIVKEYYYRRIEPLAGSRAEAQDSEDKALAARVGEMNQECGADVKLKVDWKSVSEDALKTLNVAAGCGAVVEAIANLCDDSVGKQTVKSKIKEIACRVGNKLDISVSGGKIDWTVASDATDLREHAYAHLMEHL